MPGGYSDAIAQLLQAQSRQRRPRDYFAPTPPDSSGADAIDEAIFSQPTSNLMEKGMSALSGFMSTWGGGSGGGGIGEMFGGAGGGLTGAGAAASAAPEFGGAEMATAGTAANAATPAMTPSAGNSSDLLRKLAGNQTSFGTLLRSAGVDPNTAAYSEDVIRLLGERDPNKGAKNLGRIAGIVAKFAGY